MVGVLATGGGAAYVVKDAYTIEPKVDVPKVIDVANPLADPFRITSNASLVTLYNVMPTCRIEYAEWSDGMRVANQEVAGLEDWGDIPPDRETFYKCPVSIAPDYTKLFMLVDVYYEVQVPYVPSLFWPRTKTYRFQVRTDSKGGRTWLEGYDLAGDLGHIVVPPMERGPKFIESRRHPRRPDNPPKGVTAVASGRLLTGPTNGARLLNDGRLQRLRRAMPGESSDIPDGDPSVIPPTP